MNSTSTLALADTEIYVGVWTNWSHGAILGKTLTLTRSSGNFLIAALALFVTITGTSFWRIFCFALHHSFSSEAPQDGLYHQRQAILRTSGTGVAGLWSLIRIAWAWRKNSPRVARRMLPTIAASICIISAFGAASIFSSWISTAMGNEVLLSGRNCGWTTWQKLSVYQQATLLNSYTSQVVSSSADYVQRCYARGAQRQDCPSFVRVSLPGRLDNNYTCPFDDRLCQLDFGNIRLDSGLLNSHHDLGINAPRQERFSYRRITECAPLKTKGYTKQLQGSIGPVMAYLYGRSFGVSGREDLPITQVYPLDKPLEHDGSIMDYTMTSRHTMAGYVEEFYPIAELNRSDADVSIYFVSANDITYPNQVDDPLYSAHFRWGTYYGEDSNMTLYCRDAPATVLACAHQHQLCYDSGNSSSLSSPSESCQPLSGIMQMAETFNANPNITSNSARAADMLTSAMSFAFSAEHTVRILGISALTARRSLFAGMQGPFPANQWQHEVQHWHDTSLAVLQRQVIELANGPFDQNIVPLLERPKLDSEKKVCRSQKVVNSNYSSFSVLGLSILLGIGGLINLIAYNLDWIVEAVQKRYDLDVYSRLEWTTNDTLQLQRLAHEELGLGTWSGKESSYPITMKGERLAVLEVTGHGAPKLSRPPMTYENALNGSDNPGVKFDGGQDNQSTLHGGSKYAG